MPIGAAVILPVTTDEVVELPTLTDEPECECPLCDLPLDQPHDPVTWRLTWMFDRAPAVVRGEHSLLMCDHCLDQWLAAPGDHGGHPRRFHPV